MTDTVFWSWQNDLPARLNRDFIRDALAIAVDRVSETLDVEDVERVALDHDTKATAGMADISQTILEKISRSAVVVADVTPIAKSAGGKALPNPNVMVELGYAMSAIGFERIIAVLNTANGDTVENLPFDIRHRRILTYTLAAEATKAERKAVREALIKQLAEAVRVDIDLVRDARSAAEPIQGVQSDPHSPGLWKAEWPVTHSDGFGEVARVRPLDLPRAWLRIIPAGFPNGRPSITALEQLPDSARLRAPTGAGSGGNFGSCPFGFVTYWVAGREEDGTCRSRNLAAYLEESGEVWMSDGVAFTEHKGQKHISYGHLFSNWIRGLANGMTCLDALGASKRRRIVMGIDGMSDAVWPMQSGYVPARSRKSGLLVDETERDWPDERRMQLLHRTWNSLRDAFSIEPMTKEEFAHYFEVRRRN